MEKFILLMIIHLAVSLEVVPWKHQLEYFNKKYIKFMSVTFKRQSRNSPYYVSLDVDTYAGVGNNLTLKMALFEELSSGHYQPTPIQGDYKLCDFLYKEPFFGQMYAKQLPENWTCPFPAGEYHFKNLIIHLENFPFHIPFTWSSIIVRTRVDVQGFLIPPNEEVFRWKTFVSVTQKMKKSTPYKVNNTKNSS